MSGFVSPVHVSLSPKANPMLTSPVNVTIAVASGAALKANTATSDHSGRREPPFVPSQTPASAESVIEPELPSNSLLTHVNAVAATIGNRTVLQDLSLNVATMLHIARRQDENLTSLFLRIIAAIEAMPQSDRLQFEIRAGLKPLKITLADLAMALRKPDGREAARLTAMTEAPSTIPSRAAATAATTTYLEEGTSNGQAEETLAMRAAARNSAAGQGLFSAESKVRQTDAQPADAKVLQNQLKVMFEPGVSPVPDPEAAIVVQAVLAELLSENGEASTEPEVLPPQPGNPHSVTPEQALAGSEIEGSFTITSSNLKLDPPIVDRIRIAAQAIATQSAENQAADPGGAAEKSENGDRRVQTLLTLKGFAEAVSSIPAKAVELLAIVVAEAVAPVADQADAQERAAPVPLSQMSFEAELPEHTSVTEEQISEAVAEPSTVAETVMEARIEGGAEDEEIAGERSESTKADEHSTSTPERPVPARPDLVQHGVPFVYAQVQPAREPMEEAVAEEGERDDTDDEGKGEQSEDGERGRPRDEYDAMHDPLPEEEPAIVIDRDSSEADRAFALYQRMGGF